MLSFRQYIQSESTDPFKALSRLTKHVAKDVPDEEEHYNKNGNPTTTPVMTKQIALKGYNEGEAEKMWTAYDKSGIHSNDKNLPIRSFNVRDLTPSQPHLRVDNDSLKHKIVGMDRVEGTSSTINVATHEGKHYIIDGHHRVLAARLRGDKEISARHINLDQIENPYDNNI